MDNKKLTEETVTLALEDVKGTNKQMDFYQNLQRILDFLKEEELLQPNAWQPG